MDRHAIRLWVDNVFDERRWRSLKYEEVFIQAYETANKAHRTIGDYLAHFSARRSHTSLFRRAPDDEFFSSDKLANVA